MISTRKRLDPDVFDLPVNAGANTFIDTVVTGGAPFKYETLILDSGLGTREPVIVSDVQASGGNWAVKIIGTLRHRGYRFVTVPKLLLDNPAPSNQQISAIVGAGG